MKLRLGKAQYHHTTEALRKLRLKADRRLSQSHIENVVDKSQNSNLVMTPAILLHSACLFFLIHIKLYA